MTELLSCPFCGAPAYMTSKPPWVVTCPADACAAFIDVPGSTADDAAARWNRRAPTAPQGAEPVAWLGEDKDGKIFTVFADSAARMQREGIKVTPLYAAPQGAEIARDAARYRWLRDKGNETWLPIVKRSPGLTAADIDAAIDAALTPTDAETKE